MIGKLLVIRFSALGDVAMTIPLLQRLALQYPDMDITMLSRKQYADLFNHLPRNIHFAGADLKGCHKGIKGLNRLLNEIDYKSYDAVADLHNVLRSRYLDLRFRMLGKQVAILDKGRYAKWQLTRSCAKRKRQLPSAFDRQLSVYKQLDIPVSNSNQSQTLSSSAMGIGIAPFAAHEGKCYPIEKIEEVIRLLVRRTDEQILLFGAKGEEQSILQRFQSKYPNVINIAGQYTLADELNIISTLRVMVSMDSANMHLASLEDVRVVSIWGATHPYAGFLGFNQRLSDCVQADLPCRPCSIFGNKPCRYADYRCMTQISPQQIVEKILH